MRVVSWWSVEKGTAGATKEERERMGELVNWTVSDFALADAKIEDLITIRGSLP